MQRLASPRPRGQPAGRSPRCASVQDQRLNAQELRRKLLPERGLVFGHLLLLLQPFERLLCVDKVPTDLDVVHLAVLDGLARPLRQLAAFDDGGRCR